MSEVKVNKISPRSGTDVTLGDSGDTFTVPTGVTLDTSNSTVTLPDGTVTTAKIGANAVTNAKLNNDIISGATELATEPEDTDEFLVSDAGTIKRIDYSLIKGGGITEADQWRITADKTGIGDFTSNWERNDTTGFGYLGTGMTESSGIFTFPSTGIWFIKFNTLAYYASNDSYAIETAIRTTTDNSTYINASIAVVSLYQNEANQSGEQSILFDVTNTSTHKVKFRFSYSIRSGAESFLGHTSENRTFATFIRLGDT